jgi:hypothetical protein
MQAARWHFLKHQKYLQIFAGPRPRRRPRGERSGLIYNE